ncbi:hypothetical protein LOK49_LG14G02256 [Camellia lanceoleosa]|uniref:Uncharacterized protein n=1 Tax=Camellia lanceoleosa TaxID=1840588 RepID=A0ACC0FD89_9ERIC|nr:hypothetical protein LOK49_LG14G02256 [Camellia lanceoleosa]
MHYHPYGIGQQQQRATRPVWCKQEQEQDQDHQDDLNQLQLGNNTHNFFHDPTSALYNLMSLDEHSSVSSNFLVYSGGGDSNGGGGFVMLIVTVIAQEGNNTVHGFGDNENMFVSSALVNVSVTTLVPPLSSVRSDVKSIVNISSGIEDFSNKDLLTLVDIANRSEGLENQQSLAISDLANRLLLLKGKFNLDGSTTTSVDLKSVETGPGRVVVDGLEVHTPPRWSDLVESGNVGHRFDGVKDSLPLTKARGTTQA